MPSDQRRELALSNVRETRDTIGRREWTDPERLCYGCVIFVAPTSRCRLSSEGHIERSKVGVTIDGIRALRTEFYVLRMRQKKRRLLAEEQASRIRSRR